jgi:hypothetical protein
VVGSILFVATFLVDGATRPGHKPSYHLVSSLALGSKGWVQTSNFVITGLLIPTAASGAWQTLQVVVAPALLAVFGLSLVASGVFPMDAMRGYPPGTSLDTPANVSTRHKLHDAFGILVFTSLPASCIAFGLSLLGSGLAVYSFVTAAALIVLFFVFAAAWERDSARSGLIQRSMILVGWTWIAILCLDLMR